MCRGTRNLPSRSSPAGYLLLVLIILAGTVWSLARVRLWQAPEWGDEAHYVLSGWRIATGERIYVDFYDGAQKPPLMHWTAAAAVKLLGRNAFVFPFLRMVSILCRTASVLLIFAIGRMLVNKRTALVAAMLFVFHPWVARAGNEFLTEAYSTLFSLLGLWVFLKSRMPDSPTQAAFAKGRGRLAGYVAAGLLIGLGMLYRPTPVFLALTMGLAMLADSGDWKARAQSLVGFAAGVVVGLLPLVIYLAWCGGFHNFYVMVARHALAYPSVPNSLRVRLGELKRSFFWLSGYCWFMVLGVGIGIVQAAKRRSLPGLVIGGWLVLLLVVMMFTVRQVAWHYFYELVPAWALTFALGFDYLLNLAKRVCAKGRPQGLAWLLEGDRLVGLLVTILLPVALLVLFYRLQWLATNWRAGSAAPPELWAVTWPALAAAAAGLLVIFWKSQHRYHLLLVALITGGGVLVVSPRGSAPWRLASTVGVSLCLTFACAGWLWKLRGFLWGSSRHPGKLLLRVLANARNACIIVLWLLFIWLIVGEVQTLAKFSPIKSNLKETEAAADYVRQGLADQEGIISLTGEVNFLLGRRLPIYWGADHEEVAARLGIARMVGRELADVPAYCEKHRVHFIIFYRRGSPERMGPTGASYIRQHYQPRKWIGPYCIYERVAPYHL